MDSVFLFLFLYNIAGYVLKRKHEAKMNLKIKIISAHHISWKENMNPIIKIRLSGSKIDEGRAKKWKTSV